ncbi:MAG: hypothetical protein ACI9OJ_002645 [Myxococcota bacterium]
MSSVKVLYHGRCLDGIASAATFTRFYRECIDANAEFSYQALLHGGATELTAEVLTGDVNAVVDFRYSPAPELDWWFDHHRSAFVSDEDRARFEATDDPKHQWDAGAPSCTGFIAKAAARDFGFDAAPLDDLVHWLDIVDAAKFESAESAVALKEPAYQLMVVCGELTDAGLAERLIEGLIAGDVAEVAARAEVQAAFVPIKKAQEDGLELVRKCLTRIADIALVDLLDHPDAVFNKFAPYALEPDVTYVVVVHHFDGRIKLNVGCNPWRTDARRHDISSICEQFGGGGHAVVGGISLGQAPVTHGRLVAGDVVEQLLTDPIDSPPSEE